MKTACRSVVFSAAILSAAASLVACDRPTNASANQAGEKRPTAADLAVHKPLAALIAEADALVLYEGLPHQLWESDLLASEKASKKTVALHDYPFYADAIAADGDDAKTLTAILSDAKSLTPYAGPKRCGGFHPDWCLEWQAGGEKVQCQLCFGCQEVKFFSTEHVLHADLSAAASERLASVLKDYREQRPQRAREQ